MAMIIFPFAVLMFQFSQLDSCGVSTHISIADQALESFSDGTYYNGSYRYIILKNLDAFYAGSTYPDAMYPSFCFGGHYHQVSEDTHWAPFLNASVIYIRKTFPKPWNEATRKLVAFILGVVSHQVADISWHSLGIDQGFLETMGKVNFHGSFSTAHPVGDFGGDMVSMFEGDLQGVLPLNDWYVPVGDLVNIYKELYNSNKISAEVISSCSEVLYLEAVGETLAGADIFPTFARKSPFLVEELHSYYLGGKYDMAAWTSKIWSEAVFMLENGTDGCEIPRNPLYVRCSSKQRLINSRYASGNNKLHSGRRTSLMYVNNVNRMDIINKKTPRGVYFGTKGRTAMQLKEAKMRFIGGVEKTDEGGQLLQFFTTNKYAQLGWSLITAELPLYGQVIITGAPWYGTPGNSQHGRVYLLSTSKKYSQIVDVDKMSIQILNGSNENSRFGFALAVLDFNQDGINDLATSAPSEGSNYLNYTGKVYIYYGNKNGGLNKNPDAIIEGDEHYYNLGTTLVAADVNQDGFKDLIIGSKYAPVHGEQRGSVNVFFSSQRSNFRPHHYFANQSDWLLKGEQNYSWFGSTISFHNNTSIGPLLLVSAPTFRICALKNCSYSQDDKQSVGKVYAYRWSNNSASKLIFEITGHDSLAKLGTSLAIGDPFGSKKGDILAVSAPTAAVQGYLPFHVPTTFDQAGQVYLLSLTALADKRTTVLTEAEYITRFEGNRNYGRFGWHLSWQDVNGDGIEDLVFGTPYYTEDIDEINGGEQGAVYVFYGGKFFPRGDATSNCGLVEVDPCPNDKASRYFLSSQKYGQFGKVVAMARFSNASSVLIAAPRKTSASSLHSGTIFVFQRTGENYII